MTINYSFLNNVLNPKRAFYLFFIIFLSQIANAQCANPVVGCSLTDLSNFGVDANNDATTIEYDNFVSSYHATIVRTSDGSLQVWGEKIASNGTANVLSPITINATNFPALTTAKPLKAALGSLSGSVVQGILLATDGLYAWSTEGTVLDEEITSGAAFEKLTINGNATGLPTGVNPGDVKMMFATYKTLAITTCEGDVWVISQTPEVRGNGATGNATTWYRVTTSDNGNPFLTNVVACRGNYDGLMALKADGTVHVWGSNVLLGDNTPIIASQTRAVQMTLPSAITPKMISSSGNNLLRSYYVLATDGNLYTLGENSSRQLGDWTANDRFSWVQPRYTSTTGPVMDNIKWFSVQEHDATYGSVNVINSNKNLYAFGQNSFSLLGTTGNSANPVIPDGLTTSDQILAVETGGHTSMIVKNCEGNFGYAGHRIAGSMGNGSGANVTENAYTFATAPVQICGVESLPTIKAVSIGDGPGSKYCVTHPVLLNITPPGGVLSVLSGPATISGNTVNFTAVGTAEIQYSVSDACGGVPTLTTLTLESADCSSDLEITKTVDNSSVVKNVDDKTIFTITATNNGPYKATGVIVTDALPAGYTFLSATTSKGTWSAPNWSVGDLANGASATLFIEANINATRSYANTATITGNDPDPDVANNTATATPTVNQRPIAHDDTNATIPSTAPATAINALTATDADGTIANYTVVTLPSNGTLALNGVAITAGQVLTSTEVANLTYDPNGTFSGADTFTFSATDDLGATSLPATITIPVGNNPPVAHDATVGPIAAASGAIAINALNATDTDGTIVSYTIVTLPSQGVLALNGTSVTLNQVLTPAEAAAITYNPNGNFGGNDTFTFTATDNDGAVDLTPAVVIITIEKTNIIAIADQNTVIGLNQTVTVLNVLDNDTLDNNPATLSNVDLALLTPDPTGYLTLDPDGAIQLAPNAPAGTYSLKYEICEKANPANCSNAEVKIVVTPPIMTVTVNSYCSNDAPYVSYTAFSDNTIRIGTGVLTINWIDSANNIVATQTNMPLSGSVLWPGAAVDGNNKATDWPGWIFSNGQWSEGSDGFELTKPAVTMQFILDQTTSVTVNYPRPTANCNAKPKFNINAVNENDLILADGINGSIAIVNVLDNDQLNGIQPNAANVVVAGVNLPAGITLNADGTIDVAPGTKGGPYTVTYQICEANDLTNCSTATLNIFVQVPALALLKTVQFNDSNGNGYAEVGETLSYHFSITNNGNTDLENIIIEDPLPGIVMSGGPVNLAVGQTDDYSFTASYTLTQADLIAGNVSNQATTSGISKTGIIVFDKSDPENSNTDNPTIIELSGCVIEIFNAVSADGDDMNKRFYIKNLECYPDNSVQIFNRWGVLVFEREHYNNNDIAFRGISEGRVTVKDSKGLPEGTYYYILRYKDRQSNPHQEAGYLYLTK